MTSTGAATGWTGIQYSVYRGGLALAVSHVCWTRLGLVEGPPWPLLALGLPGALAFALGWRDRAVATALFAVVAGLAAFIDGAPLVLPKAAMSGEPRRSPIGPSPRPSPLSPSQRPSSYSPYNHPASPRSRALAPATALPPPFTLPAAAPIGPQLA